MDFEAIVIDNCSGDNSFELSSELMENPRFTFIQAGENIGFAKANNIAAEASTGRILHFLNPDTEVSASLNEDYLYALAHSETVYVNPLVNPNGSLENDIMPVPYLKNLLLWNFCRRSAEIWYKGASVIISRENFYKIGGWSNEYFLYAEDLDLFHKINLAGVPIASLSSVIYHFGGGSSSRLWSRLERAKIVERSNRIFYRKFFGMAEYHFVKLYYLVHNLIKHPKILPVYLKSWMQSGND